MRVTQIGGGTCIAVTSPTALTWAIVISARNRFIAQAQCSVGYALTERNEEAVQCGARYFNSASDDPSLSDYRFLLRRGAHSQR
ncbi:MAG: hypothetical protein U0703_24360 [Anaerolineae bacterium]